MTDITSCYDCIELFTHKTEDGRIFFYCPRTKKIVGWIKPKRVTARIKHPTPIHDTDPKCKPKRKKVSVNKTKEKKKNFIWRFMCWLTKNKEKR
jgi:hypothetical protein